MRRWRLLLPIGWMGVIWFLSSIPSSGHGDLGGIVIPEVIQNGAHAVVFGILAASWTYALGSTAMTPLRVVLYCAGYSIVDELHQTLVPGRTASFLDVVVDLIGVITVVLLITRYVRYRHLESERL